MIPIGNKLFPDFFKTFLAPASMKIFPFTFNEFAIHCFFEPTADSLLKITVPIFSSLFKILINIFFFVPLQIIVFVFDLAAFFAAEIFVIIPPRPSALLLGPAYFCKFLSDTEIELISLEVFFIFGSLVYNPFWSVSITKSFASLRFATREAKVSLSPNLISSVEIVSFSFIIGTVLYLIRFDKVFLAFKYLVLSLKSS